MSGPLPDLENEWRKDVARFPGQPALDIFRDILARHGESQRRYHGPSHLVALFDLLSKHAPHIRPGSAPRLAIWWHDAVYNPRSPDNEERSADLARSHLLRMSTPSDLVEQTVRLILMTKNHWSGPSAGDGGYFLDADIAILGAPPDIYDRYASDVRQEYAFAPEDAFRAGRSTFLRSVLARSRLFRTDAFETAYGGQARVNIQRELVALSGAAP